MKAFILTLILLLNHNIFTQTLPQTSIPFTDLYMNGDTGRMWFDPSSSFMDSAIANMQKQQQIQQMMFSSTMTGLMVESFMKENYGREKVSARRATSRIITSPQGSITEAMVAKANTPQEKQETRQMISLCLQTFNNILKARAMAPYDAADGNALAFVLSYIAYYDEDPGTTRLKVLAKDYRNRELKDLVFQGTPDKEKQQVYENIALQTMLAIRAYQLSKRNDVSSEEKQTAKVAAQNYAQGVLKKMWSGDSTKIALTKDGFGDRGKALISANKSSTTFSRDDSILASANYITKRYDYLETDESYFTKLLQEFDSEVERHNGLTNDGAWANAVAFSIAYKIYTDGKVDLNQKQFEWVIKQMRDDMSKDSTYQGYSNLEKQEYYEITALTVMVILDKYRYALNNTDKYTNSAERQRKFAIESALNELRNIFQPRKFDDYILTPTGFDKKL